MHHDEGSDHSSVVIGESEVVYRIWGEGRPDVVMLHAGLSSIELWRDVPARIAQQCGATVLAYDRPGHGQSLPTPVGSWPADWMFTQAELLGQLCQRLAADDVLLVGHSDGGSIGLINAARSTHHGGPEVRGLVALAPHSYVEQVCVDEIEAMRSDPAATVTALARFHRHSDALFEAWSGVWVSDEFRHWDIRPELSNIKVPCWIAQGDRDEYATDGQLWQTAGAIGSQATALLIPDAGHLLPDQQPDAVVSLIADAYATCFSR